MRIIAHKPSDKEKRKELELYIAEYRKSCMAYAASKAWKRLVNGDFTADESKRFKAYVSSL